jgi:flagellar basal body P-ring formation protein FlgA
MKNLRIEKIISLIFLLSACIIIGAMSDAFALEITVKQSAAVRGDTIRLGDIAQFDTEEDSRVAQLRLIEISASPLPGMDSTVNKDLLIYKINPFISGNKDVLIKVPEILSVHRDAQFVTSESMKEIFMAYIKDNIEWPVDQMRFEDITVPGAVALPQGELQWIVNGKAGDDLIGNVALIIEFSVNDKLVRRVQVSGKVSLNMETIKAARKIEKGRIISAEDLATTRENTLHIRKDAVINKEDVIGKRAIRTIQDDQTILTGMLENVPLVKKGDKVIIKAENSRFKITASGEALQDGRTGDQVQVLNLQSGGKVFGIVRASGLVEVFF